MSNINKKQARLRRQRRVRAKVKGTAQRPRLSVFRSLNHIYAQVIDDVAGRTVCAASDADVKTALASSAKDGKAGIKEAGGRKAKVAEAFAVGQIVAGLAKKAGIESVVYDRNGFAYSGRVAALADGAREGGLKF